MKKRRANVKNMTLPVAVAVAIIGCVLAVSANVTTSKMHQNLEKERYKRIVAEEQLQKTQAKIRSMGSELKAAQAKIGSIEEILNLGASAKKDLEAKLQGVEDERAQMSSQIQQLQGQLKKRAIKPAAAQAVPSP